MLASVYIYMFIYIFCFKNIFIYLFVYLYIYIYIKKKTYYLISCRIVISGFATAVASATVSVPNTTWIPQSRRGAAGCEDVDCGIQ